METKEAKKSKIDLYTVLFVVISLCIFVGPIIFIIFGTNRIVDKDGKLYNPTERHYIVSVCVVTLIVCGSLLILTLASKLRNLKVNKKQIVEENK